MITETLKAAVEEVFRVQMVVLRGLLCMLALIFGIPYVMDVIWPPKE